jgi:hypothetical protein
MALLFRIKETCLIIVSIHIISVSHLIASKSIRLLAWKGGIVEEVTLKISLMKFCSTCDPKVPVSPKTCRYVCKYTQQFGIYTELNDPQEFTNNICKKKDVNPSK